MFEQSFKYISSVIHRFFEEVPPKAGDRFHIRLEKKEEVKKLYLALCGAARFKFRYGEYKSRSKLIDGIQLMIASSHNASESFLTRLRNGTAGQKGSFDRVALLTIHDTSLDSIVSGSQSLNKEGAPLHIASFKKSLAKDLEGLNLDDSELETLNLILNSYNQNIHEDNNAILAYYPFMNVVQRGKIDTADWNELGLFHDPEIQTVQDKKAIKNRVFDNKKLFGLVQRTHKYGRPEEDLVKHFIHSGINKLKDEQNWQNSSYGQVRRWYEARMNATPPEYLGRNDRLPLDGVEVWERAEGTTAAAQRKRHLLLFNTNQQDEITHFFQFDQVLKQAYIKVPKKSNIIAEQQSKQIKLIIKNCGKLAVFGQVTYDDENASGKYVFNIAVLPFSSSLLNSYKTTYFVKAQARDKRIRLNADDLLVFNDGGAAEERYTIYEDSEIPTSPQTKVVAEPHVDFADDILQFYLLWDGIKIPCELVTDNSKPVLITGLKIWKYKREQKKSFLYANDNKLLFGNDEYFTNRQRTLEFLELEKEITSEYPNYCFWQRNKNGIAPQYLEIDHELLKKFKALTNYYNRRQLLPSLTSTTETEIIELMKEYVATFERLLSEIEIGQPLNKKTHNLLKVGTIEQNEGQHQIYLTPLHPLNVAYQLHIHKILGEEELPEEILNSLSASDLLPYINGPHGRDDKYCPVNETELPEWVVYRPFITIHKGWHNEYVHRLVAEKIYDYINHFPYLFTGSSGAPVKINLINLGNCVDALNGVVRYFLRYIDQEKGDSAKIHPLSIRIYDDQTGLNKFEEFALYDSPEKIAQDFEIDLRSKHLDEYDVLKIIKEKLDFYIKPKSEHPSYAHLTFFKFAQENIQWTYHNMLAVKTGCSLQGLVNAVPSVFAEEEYITGFGAKYTSGQQRSLIDFACKFNAFARVANTQDPYSEHEAAFATLRGDEKNRLDKIYEKSNWVTFIDPKVDLNFFNEQKDSKDLIIIHYSDQYNNTSGYDAITVTRKSKQYRSILQEFLSSRGASANLSDELKLINMFNAINGDWLLRLISSKRGHFSREKISILSAVNTMLALLKHPDIVWVPLSLEEILRVSGSVGLKKNEGLFSAKNLGSLGTHCDDLLMAGVEQHEDQVKVYLYPVEIKIGGDQTNKGVEQSIRTADVLKDYLSGDSFKSKFYRNFFAKLIVVAAEKMALYEIFTESDMNLITDKYRTQLLSDDFSLHWDLMTYIGKGALLSFKSTQFSRKLVLEGESLIIEMLESDGSENMLKTPGELFDVYSGVSSSLNQERLLSNCYKNVPEPVEHVEQKQKTDEVNYEIVQSVSYREEYQTLQSSPEYETVNTSGMQILFGHDVNSGKQIHWEPNNTNKVMHTNTGIIGTMGTGKTQFTKSLVTQLVWESKQNVNGTRLGFLIFDYKGDYIKDDFVEATNAKCYNLYHLPYNPLALTQGQKIQPMLPLHTANAIKESISTAFGLGVVQKQKLRDCIMAAYNSCGIDKADSGTWNRSAPTISNVCEEYLSSDDVKQDSLYAALDNLHQFEIFEPNSEETISLWDLLNGVVVINLAGYDQDIQNLVVAITLDQFYSQMQKAGHSNIDGDFREISKMVLVDEADNFLSQNFQSIRKILKEGREFGVGTILSTQFLNHFSTGDNEFSNYILTWVSHRVSEINKKDVATMFGKFPSEMVNQLMSEISSLEKHVSICNIGDGKPLMIRDKAFWQLI